MVTIKVFFEGGAVPQSNPNAAAAENNAALRESFNKLLNAGLTKQQIKIEAEPAYSISQIVKIREKDSYLLMDLDGDKSMKPKRITDNQLTDIQDVVFFMVQRMEAWILSQPDKIELYFQKFNRKHKNPLLGNTLLKNRHPESLNTPDVILDTILMQTYEQEKAGKMKNVRYKGQKLRLAPSLIEMLDIQQLRKDFEDVDGLLASIEKAGK
jgi:Domain of unknown function (DUF4276)